MAFLEIGKIKEIEIISRRKRLLVYYPLIILLATVIALTIWFIGNNLPFTQKDQIIVPTSATFFGYLTKWDTIIYVPVYNGTDIHIINTIVKILIILGIFGMAYLSLLLTIGMYFDFKDRVKQPFVFLIKKANKYWPWLISWSIFLVFFSFYFRTRPIGGDFATTTLIVPATIPPALVPILIKRKYHFGISLIVLFQAVDQFWTAGRLSNLITPTFWGFAWLLISNWAVFTFLSIFAFKETDN